MSIEEKVQACKTLEELSNVILEIADENGEIQGSSRAFNAKFMAHNCKTFSIYNTNSLTRNYGIRQQALSIIDKHGH